jgi:hypothetical protein
VGVTETPLIDLPATPVMEAKLGKCGHCDWTTLSKHSILMARKLRVNGLKPTDADVVRADRLLSMLQCARLFHRIGHVDLADSMRDGDVPGFLVTFGLGIFGYVEMLYAASAFISPSSLPLCRTCEDLVLSACGFDALLSLCSGPCPCVAAPVGVLDLTKPAACVPACEGASVPNTSCVLAVGVHAEEAPASALSSACYAVPETSAVQQPVMEVHSKSTAFCACVDAVAEQNFQMDIPPVLPVLPELPAMQPECAIGVPFEETDEEVVDWGPLAQWDGASHEGSGVSAPLADVQPLLDIAIFAELVHDVDDVEWGDWTAFVETHIDYAAVAAVDALAVCKLSGWLTAVPAMSAAVCAVSSVGFVAEIQQTLLLAVVCSALATRCRVAFAASSSVVVEFIDPGCDPPLLSCY